MCSAATEIPRFSAPWTAEEHDFCFIVRDSNYQVLAYIYFGDDPLWRVTARRCTHVFGQTRFRRRTIQTIRSCPDFKMH